MITNPLAMTTLVPQLASVQLDIDVTVAIQFVTFAVFLVAMRALIINDYMRVRDARAEGTSGAEDEATELAEQATTLRAKYEAEMTQARREAMEVRESLRNQGVAEQQDIHAEVRDELGGKLAEERTRIAALVAAAEAEIEARASDLAAQMVEKVLPEA